MDAAPASSDEDTPSQQPQPSERRPRRSALRSADVRVFSSASDAPRARRPTDAVLLAFAVLFVTALSLLAPGPTTLDTSLSTFITNLPGLLGWFWEIAYDLLYGWALFLIATSLIAHDRKRLFLDEILAVIFVIGFAALAGTVAGTTWSEALRGFVSTDPPAIYPAMRVALATAVIVTASPHLGHPLKVLGRCVVAVGAIAAIALAVALPIGVICGFVVGVGAAAFVHLLRGSPGGRLTLEQVGTALADLGVEASDIRQTRFEPSGVALALATAPDGGTLLVKTYGRDAWDGQLLASVWSSLWHRGETPRFGGSRLQQVEHEAFVTLFVERAGVPALPVVAAGLATQRDAMLVIDASGRQVSDLASDEIDDRLLGQMWTIAATLNDLRVAHGSMDARRFVVRPGGSLALGDFSQASVSADDTGLLADRAQLLVSTALLVDHERAVAVADASLGHDGLAEVLPYLQPAAVDRATRRTLRERDWDLGDLRQLAADTAGVELPKLEQIRRVTVASVATVVILGLVAYAIISALAQVGLQSLIDEFKGADWTWLLAALLVTPFVQVAQAFSTMGASVRPVRSLPVLMLEYAIQFIALAVPSSAARVALEIRFFQKFGVPTTGAAAIGVLDSVCGFVVQIVLILAILLSGLATLNLSTSSSSGSTPTFTGKFLVIGIVVVLIGVVVILAVPKYRGIIRAKAADGKAALRVLRSPSKLLMIFGGNLVAQILLATILGLCVLAFGHHLSLAELILINTVVSLFAGFMPVPGGMGVAEAGYTAGLVAFGIPHTAALSIALAFRLVTFYLPPIWGGFAMRWLRHHSYV